MAIPASVTDLPRQRPETADRILRAAFECIADVGLERTTVEDVARAAGLSRQTVYRYFPSKDRLVMALVLREEERFLDGVRASFAHGRSVREALEEAILFCLRFAREHPLLDRVLQVDAGTLLPYLTTRSGPVIARARRVLVDLLAPWASIGRGALREAADGAVRVVLSYVLAPPDRPPAEVARHLARILSTALGPEEARR